LWRSPFRNQSFLTCFLPVEGPFLFYSLNVKVFNLSGYSACWVPSSFYQGAFFSGTKFPPHYRFFRQLFQRSNLPGDNPPRSYLFLENPMFVESRGFSGKFALLGTRAVFTFSLCGTLSPLPCALDTCLFHSSGLPPLAGLLPFLRLATVLMITE